MGDFTMVYVFIAIIGLVMLFSFLKMHENLKSINEKLSKTNELLEKIVKNNSDK